MSSDDTAHARVLYDTFAHPLSYTTTKIRVLFNEFEIGTGTGFIVNFAGHYAMVTNLHVLSGRHAITGQPLHRMGSLPNRISFHVTAFSKEKSSLGSFESLNFKEIIVDLYDDKNNHIWIDSENANPVDDFALIYIDTKKLHDDINGYDLKSISIGDALYIKSVDKGNLETNSSFALLTNLHPPVGSDVFVLGYPKGLELTGVFPIWKRASIATEPQCPVAYDDIGRRNLFYIDGNTKPGMSGAPVIYITKSGVRLVTDEGHPVDWTPGVPILLGVYAGRDGVTPDEHELSLGRVWKTASIRSLMLEAIGRQQAEAKG
ncbi:trypsin-like peptidase domain-containing protein [Ancylobacter sp. WKF20]|uniref:trypsin-like peptidase domain-containing protein n=1 Tax=Ancylobacter sp. WKF20 TaxID=3039801 RepID=UPI0024342D19|nr:trypsin-like peptidase domain-containing protein [Ancylobacter sp. WKF20]WGD31879.1 trypsin-like peptidase domain-containing protein [Ancylobacter sp. WKF20]